MKILLSGSSGLIGSAIREHLMHAGHNIFPLIRPTRVAKSGEIVWNHSERFIQHNRLESFDGIIHLGGENIFGRWTEQKKSRLYSSRIISTSFLAETAAELFPAPKFFLCASAVGIYGSREDEILTEKSDSGDGFLAKVCRDWEEACRPAEKAGIRVVNLRFGIVLSEKGGALGKMLGFFKKGLGGRLGPGNQWMSWISITDAAGAIQFLLENDSLSGPVNLTSAEPVTNKEFTRVLAGNLHRPALVPVPAAGLRLLYGKMADEVLLASLRVMPEKIQQAGFKFRYSNLEAALKSLL